VTRFEKGGSFSRQCHVALMSGQLIMIFKKRRKKGWGFFFGRRDSLPLKAPRVTNVVWQGGLGLIINTRAK